LSKAGSAGLIRTAVSAQPLDPTAAIAEVSAPGFGAVAVFVGTVRESPAGPGGDDKQVVSLDYEAHPTLAEAQLRAIAEAAAEKWEVGRVVAVHRNGACELGEPTVVVACGAPHRGDALEACRWIIDTIKAEVPIWKREVYADGGGSAWVGAP
jgi:molybdopterin synthase catalytic subunit